MQNRIDDIRAAGATLVAISPQRAELSREIIQAKNLEFDILVDASNGYADKLGIAFTVSDELKAIYLSFGIDLGRSNGDSSWRLPMPTRLVIDRSGIVRSAEIDPDYTSRPEPESTIEILKGL